MDSLDKKSQLEKMLFVYKTQIQECEDSIQTLCAQLEEQLRHLKKLISDEKDYKNELNRLNGN